MYFGFFPVSIIPPLLHTHFRLHASPTRTKERSLGNCTKQCSFVYRRALDKQILFSLVLIRNIIYIIDSKNIKKETCTKYLHLQKVLYIATTIL
jgi:hypothetical protein